MLTGSGKDVIFVASFIASKSGKTGLTPTVNVYRVSLAGSVTTVVTGGASFEIGSGLYGYRLVAASNTAAGLLAAAFTTSDTTVDQKTIYSLWVVDGASPVDAVLWGGSTLPSFALASVVTGRFDTVDSTLNDIDTKTANLPSDPADASVIAGRFDTVDTALVDISAKTTNLPSDPADASVIAGRFDTVDAALTGISAKTANLPTDPADASVIAGRFDTVDTTLAGIHAKTVNLPADPVSSGLVVVRFNSVDSAIAAVFATTMNLPTDPADASVIAGRFDTLDTTLAAITAKTTNLPSDPADASVIAGRFDTVDSAIAAVIARTDNLPADTAQELDDIATLIGTIPASVGDIVVATDISLIEAVKYVFCVLTSVTSGFEPGSDTGTIYDVDGITPVLVVNMDGVGNRTSRVLS